MRILRVLLVDDDPEFLDFAKEVLTGAKYTVTVASNFKTASSDLQSQKGKTVVLADLKVGKESSVDFMIETLKKFPQIPFTLLGHSPPLESVIEALKQGAYDFLRKPVEPHILRHSVGRSSEKLSLSLETEKQEKETQQLLFRLKEELKKSRAHGAFKGFLISTAAHDFRSILTVLDGYHQMVKIQCRECGHPVASPLLDQARRSIVRLRTMAATLLDYEASEAGELKINRKTFELDALLAESVSFYQPHAEQKNLSLGLEAIPSPLRAKGDPDRVMQILDNLLYNAIKFTPAKGEIRVGAKAEDEKFATVWIRDSGLGISDEILKKVLDREAIPAKKDGDARFGLGLSICKRLIEVQNGKIWIESKPGVGSVVYFSLPA
jgi:signal transduction histidine kinase